MLDPISRPTDNTDELIKNELARQGDELKENYARKKIWENWDLELEMKEKNWVEKSERIERNRFFRKKLKYVIEETVDAEMVQLKTEIRNSKVNQQLRKYPKQAEN